MSIPDGLRVAVLTRAVYPDHGVGGLERSTHDLVRHLLERGVQVTLITRPPSSSEAGAGWTHPGLSRRAVPYRSFPWAGRRGTTILDRSTAYPLFGYRAGRVAARLAAAGEVDLVYGLGASTIGYALARRRGEATAPFILNPQGLEEFGGLDGRYGGQPLKALGYAPLRRVVSVCADAADRLIATDRALIPLLETHLHAGPDRIRLVPNAVDVAGCDALAGRGDGVRLRASAGIGPDDIVWLSVGRVERNKGFHVLVDALAALKARPWRWVLVGDGPMRPEIARRVADAGLADRVTLVGRVSEATLHAWYEAATLFVHPTLYEGSSLVTLEAMTHRRPVVATRTGGLPDKVRPGETGWLVPPGDAGALADALGATLDSGAKLTTIGLAGRALVDAEFSWAQATGRMMAVFGELVTRARML